MNVSAAGSTSLYNYLNALSGNGQKSAVFQALTSAYTNAGAGSYGSDALTALVGQSNASGLVSAIYTSSQALQTSDTSGIQGLSPSQVVGGLDASAASTLLTGLSSASSGSGLQGFESAISGSSSLASAGSQARQTYGSGNLTSEAQTQAAADLNNAQTGTTTLPAYLQQASALAQLAAMNNTFTLLA